MSDWILPPEEFLPPESPGRTGVAAATTATRRRERRTGFGKPRRLQQVFQKYEPPIYFVTFCTLNRRKVLANSSVHAVVVDYGNNGAERGYALGRYVIMPDNVHLFVRGTIDFVLADRVRGLKRVVAAAVSGGRGIWQRGFFDHLIRNSESYSAKWNYVRENPVRAELVPNADDWPFQGEIVRIEHR